LCRISGSTHGERLNEQFCLLFSILFLSCSLQAGMVQWMVHILTTIVQRAGRWDETFQVRVFSAVEFLNFCRSDIPSEANKRNIRSPPIKIGRAR
jgi:hypothetical protein